MRRGRVPQQLWSPRVLSHPPKGRRARLGPRRGVHPRPSVHRAGGPGRGRRWQLAGVGGAAPDQRLRQLLHGEQRGAELGGHVGRPALLEQRRLVLRHPVAERAGLHPGDVGLSVGLGQHPRGLDRRRLPRGAGRRRLRARRGPDREPERRYELRHRPGRLVVGCPRERDAHLREPHAVGADRGDRGRRERCRHGLVGGADRRSGRDLVLPGVLHARGRRGGAVRKRDGHPADDLGRGSRPDERHRLHRAGRRPELPR